MNNTAVLQHILRSGIMITLPGNLPLQSIITIGDALLAAPTLAVQIDDANGDEISLLTDLRRRAEGNMVIGIGGVETEEQVTAVARAGAHFISSPRLNYELAAACQNESLLYIPSVISIMAANSAVQAGVQMVAVRTGGPQGPDYIGSMMSAIPDLAVAVSGDFQTDEVVAYAKAGTSALIVDEPLFAQPNMSEIITRARQLQQAWDDGSRQQPQDGLFSQPGPHRPSLN